MGAATSVLAGYTCHACSMNFSIDPNGEHTTQGSGVLCPRCGGPAERRAATAAGTAQLVVTPSGLVMTEDTLRQLLMAQLSPAPGAQPEQLHGAIEAMVQGLRQARDGDGLDAALLQAISRSMAEAQSQQAPPAAARVLATLPKRRWSAAKNARSESQAADECAICLTAYQEGDEMSLLPCKHELHTQCLTPWLKQTNSCPLCRHQLETDSEEYEERRRQQDREGVGSERERPRPSPIQTHVSSPAASGASRGSGSGQGASPSVPTLGEFGVYAPDDSTGHATRASFSSPSTAGSGATAASPASARSHARSGLRRGFLQDRGTRGLGEEGTSPQQAAAATMAGINAVRHVERQDLRLPSQAAANSRTLRVPGALSASAGAETSEGGQFSSVVGSGRRGSDANGSAGSDPRSWSVRKLKGVLRNARVPHQDCLEKDDLVRRCLDSRLNLAASEREYDAMLAAGRDDVGATRVPRQPAPVGGAPGRGNARLWSPTTSAAASVLSSDWLAGGRPGVDSSTSSPLASLDFLSGSPNASLRRDSLAGRTPVQERNTAAHSYARLPRIDRRPSATAEGGSDYSDASAVTLTPRHSDAAPSTFASRRPSGRNLYQRPSTSSSGKGGVDAEAPHGIVRTTVAAATSGGDAQQGATAAASQPQPGRRGSQRAVDDKAARPASRGASRRIRLGPVRDGAGAAPATDATSAVLAPDASLEQGAVSSPQRRPQLSLPNSRGNSAAGEPLEGQMLSGPGSSSSIGNSNARRPGSSAGLHSRAPSSSSWRPVVAVDHQESAHGRSAASGGVGPSVASSQGAAGAGIDGEASDGESEALPAEDPYVRLLRERDREWRGRTLQMMSGGEDDEGGSLVDRYVRLGR